MKKFLAINNGRAILKKPFPYPNTYTKLERDAALRVLKSGVLSEFVADYGQFFSGGKEVKRFEKLFAKKFKVRHAVSMNSATTALHAAIIALKIGPGDEVIVTPYSMCASVSVVLMNGAIPVFADIDENSFCLSSKSLLKKISSRTKAIIAVNLFGASAELDTIMKIAKEHNLKVIEDNAQAPGGRYKGKYAGTIGDIGVFSLNFHKVIQCGEGGVFVTNSDEYAFRAKLARNHGEVVIDQVPHPRDEIILGSNYRMTEMHAAIAYEQVKKLDFLTRKRVELAKYLTHKLEKIPGVEVPRYGKEMKHVYYVFPIKIHERRLGVSRDTLVDAMKAEGFPMSKGYVKPIYLLPIFQNKKVFNNFFFPFEGKYFDTRVSYKKGICPVCERMYEKEFTFTSICQYPRTKKDINLFIQALEKVLKHKDELL